MKGRTSLVVQWLRIHSAMQGTQVCPLIRELRPRVLQQLSPHTTTTEPSSQMRVPAPQLDRLACHS